VAVAGDLTEGDGEGLGEGAAGDEMLPDFRCGEANGALKGDCVLNCIDVAGGAGDIEVRIGEPT
jgi:hypothetical protein